MKKQLTMIYTGDMRGNKRVMMANHLTLITRLQDLVDVHTEAFTKDSDRRGRNPYDHNEPDIKYRRGEGGAVQLWDFVDAVERTTGDIVMKMRTDVWFTPMSVDLICDAVQRILDDQADVFYMGSDWIAHKMDGHEFEVSNAIKLLTDFVIIARRDRLRPCQEIKQQIADTPVQKRRSGNKTFRWLVMQGRDMTARTYSVFANIWLIRATYDPEHFPSDWDVCRDYIQSYIEAKDGGIEKKNFWDKQGNRIPCPMQFAVNWWREKQGWGPQEIDPHNVRRWQSR
jgi:hypothetical protein